MTDTMEYAIVIHGGAGTISKSHVNPTPYWDALKRIILDAESFVECHIASETNGGKRGIMKIMKMNAPSVQILQLMTMVSTAISY